MKPKKRQKMCYNCEGEIDLDVIVCPFCAADLRVEKPEQLRPLFSSRGEVTEREPLFSPPPEESSVMTPEEAPQKKMWPPTLLFALGLQLALFGLLLLVFSREGVLQLQWDGALWFLYLFASIPCLVFGYRGLSKL